MCSCLHLVEFDAKPRNTRRATTYDSFALLRRRKYTVPMNLKLLAFATLASIGVVQGCAVTRPALEIDVTDNGFTVGGQVLKTQAELTTAIRTSGATECRVIPSPATAYAQVAMAMGSLRDSGCRSGIIGNVGP